MIRRIFENYAYASLCKMAVINDIVCVGDYLCRHSSLYIKATPNCFCAAVYRHVMSTRVHVDQGSCICVGSLPGVNVFV